VNGELTEKTGFEKEKKIVEIKINSKILGPTASVEISPSHQILHPFEKGKEKKKRGISR